MDTYMLSTWKLMSLHWNVICQTRYALYYVLHGKSIFFCFSIRIEWVHSKRFPNYSEHFVDFLNNFQRNVFKFKKLLNFIKIRLIWINVSTRANCCRWQHWASAIWIGLNSCGCVRVALVASIQIPWCVACKPFG